MTVIVTDVATDVDDRRREELSWCEEANDMYKNIMREKWRKESARLGGLGLFGRASGTGVCVGWIDWWVGGACDMRGGVDASKKYLV